MVGVNIVDHGVGEGKRAGLWPILQGCGPRHPVIWV